MAKLTPQEILDKLSINGVGLDQPTYISPNGGSLKWIQEEIQAVYALLFDIIDSLDPKVWTKKDTP